MTTVTRTLQLVSSPASEPGVEASSTDTASPLVPLAGTGPDGGRRAHPATSTTVAGQPRYPDLVSVQNDIVGFVCDLVDAPDSAVGTVAGGVLEAALIVVQAARDARPLVRRPTMVIADSAHPAYLAAAESLGVVPIVVPVDREGRAAIGPMSAALQDETVLLVASAPSFRFGLVDPIAWLGAAAGAKAVPLHVDASCGGWSIAYAERTGRVGSVWSFAVPAVSSITLAVGPDDGGPVGTTVVLHRDAEARRGLARARGLVDDLSTWRPASDELIDVAETLREVGHDGCSVLATDGREALERVVEGLVDLRGVHTIGHPEGTAITLGTDATCDVFTLADELAARGWSCEPILSGGTWPAVLRLPVTAAVLPLVEQLVVDVAEAVVVARAAGRQELHPSLEAMLEGLRPFDVEPAMARRVVEAAGYLDGEGREVATRLLLDAAVPGVREALVSARQDLVFRPNRVGWRQAGASASTDASE